MSKHIFSFFWKQDLDSSSFSSYTLSLDVTIILRHRQALKLLQFLRRHWLERMPCPPLPELAVEDGCGTKVGVFYNIDGHGKKKNLDDSDDDSDIMNIFFNIFQTIPVDTSWWWASKIRSTSWWQELQILCQRPGLLVLNKARGSARHPAGWWMMSEHSY